MPVLWSEEEVQAIILNIEFRHMGLDHKLPAWAGNPELERLLGSEDHSETPKG